jgi:hypothetical protein
MIDFLKIPKANSDLASDVIKRYTIANEEMATWLSTLSEVYRLVFPNKAKFRTKGRVSGQNDYMKHVYDWTAISGAKSYASNLISTMMPAGVDWFKIGVGYKYKGQQADVGKGTKDLLAHMSQTVFRILNSSNFYQAIHPSLMEMSISTGVLLVNETDDLDNPIIFTSVPLHECCFSAGANQMIQNVYRKYVVKAHTLKEQWPKAKWSAKILSIIDKNPDQEIGIIESTEKNADMPLDKQWQYSIVLEEFKETPLIEYRSYSPFIVFRPSVYSGEIMGRGVMLDMISAVRILNKIAEDELRLNSYMAKPIFMSPNGSGAINPYMVRMEPGSIIPYQSIPGSSRPPVEQLTIQGNLQYLQLNSEKIKNEIIRALGINPIQPDGNTQETATRSQLLDAAWVKSNQEIFGRLTPELCNPLVKTIFHILHRKGYWKMPIVDGKIIDIEYTSPIMDTQKKQNITRITQYAETLQATLGPEGAMTAFAYGINATEYPGWLANQFNIDSIIQRGELSKSQMLKIAHQQMQQQQQQQLPQPQPTAPGGQNGQQQGFTGSQQPGLLTQ